MRRTLAALVHSAARAELATLIAIIVTAVGLLAFGVIAGEVLDGDTGAFDRRLLLALRVPGNPTDPIGPTWFEETMRDITALGSTGVLGIMVLVVFGFLWMAERRHAAWLVLGAVVSGLAMSQLAKLGFSRPRPDLVPHGTVVHTASFPSGHATMSALIYLTLGALLARTQARRRIKVYVLTVAVLLALLVGISRIYLGVHWPTDVLAGWALGAAWATGSWLTMVWLQQRGDVEPEGNGDDGTLPTERLPS